MILFKNRSIFFRFTFIALGNPILFALFLFLMTDNTLGKDSIRIFGYETFAYVECNVYRINLLFFIIFSFIAYYAWTSLQIFIISLFKKINLDDFMDDYLSIENVIVSSLGVCHLLVWCVGMEGNMFAFMFGIPLIFLVCFRIILFLAQVCRVFQGKYDQKF